MTARAPQPSDPGQPVNGQLPPILLTTARWRNRRRRVSGDYSSKGASYDRWSKVLAHKGPYEQFAYGTDTPSNWPARGGRNEGPLQKCLICYVGSGLIAVDVDDEQAYQGTRTGKLIGRQHALSTRGRGFHVLLDCRGIPLENWPPRQNSIAGADIKSKGFIPVPGCRHYSGERYELTDFGRHGPGLVTGTPELIEAIKADQADHHEHRRQAGAGGSGGPGGDGGGHDGEIAGAVLSMVLRGLSKEQCYAGWLKIAIPRDPGYPFTADDFERHHGGAVRKAEQIRADEWQAWTELMAWRAS